MFWGGWPGPGRAASRVHPDGQLSHGWCLLSSALGVLVTAGGRGGETEAGVWSIPAALMKEEGVFGGSGVPGSPKVSAHSRGSLLCFHLFSFLKSPEWCQ